MVNHKNDFFLLFVGLNSFNFSAYYQFVGFLHSASFPSAISSLLLSLFSLISRNSGEHTSANSRPRRSSTRASAQADLLFPVIFSAVSSRATTPDATCMQCNRPRGDSWGRFQTPLTSSGVSLINRHKRVMISYSWELTEYIITHV